MFGSELIVVPSLWAQFYSYSALPSMQRGSFVGKGWMKRRMIESR
jgi:hypothetical protein